MRSVRRLMPGISERRRKLPASRLLNCFDAAADEMVEWVLC